VARFILLALQVATCTLGAVLMWCARGFCIHVELSVAWAFGKALVFTA
jgi:hypothetical protein